MSEEFKVKVNPTFHEQHTGESVWKKETDEKYIEYRKKWFNNPKEFILENAPLNMDIEISSACNLRCPMCDRTIEMEKGEERAYHSGLMNFDLYKKIIDEAVAIGVYAVKLNWRGEPLMHPRVVEMVRYAKDKGIIDIMFNTNGVLLSEKMSEDLIEAGIDKILISFDSIKKDRFEKYRAGADFDKVMNNVITLKNVNDRTGHKVETRVSKVSFKETEDENEEYNNLFGKIVDKVAYLDYIPYGEKDFGKPVDRTYKDFKFACSQLWNRLFVSWDGKYAMCCCDTKEVDILGDAYTQTIQDIWLGEKLKIVRAKHQEGNWFDVEQCRSCYSPYL